MFMNLVFISLKILKVVMLKSIFTFLQNSIHLEVILHQKPMSGNFDYNTQH